MKRLTSLGLCAIAMAMAMAMGIAGCVVVDSPVPIGETATSVAASDWQGTWLYGEGAVVARVVDMEKGKIEIAWIETENGAFVLRKRAVEIRQSGDWMFANLSNEDAPDRFVWARIRGDGREVLLWIPDNDKIEALVKDGTLAGTVDDKGNVRLGALSADQMKRLTTDDKGNLYSWANPITLRRWSEKLPGE